MFDVSLASTYIVPAQRSSFQRSFFLASHRSKPDSRSYAEPPEPRFRLPLAKLWKTKLALNAHARLRSAIGPQSSPLRSLRCTYGHTRSATLTFADALTRPRVRCYRWGRGVSIFLIIITWSRPHGTISGCTSRCTKAP